jgi:ABC-type cobalamin/Fe3+-siderophores transport system ATPase subunit
MIFSGEEALKPAEYYPSEKSKCCMLSRMMMERANVLMLDEPTSTTWIWNRLRLGQPQIKTIVSL